MKNKVLCIILVIGAAVWAVWSIAAGIGGLAKPGASPLSESSPKGSICELKAVYAKEVYDIDHKLMVILPLGTERYYLVLGENDSFAPMLVKASRGWFEKNFTEQGIAKREVVITGEVREFRSKYAYKISEVNRSLGAVDSSISVSEARYVDSLYKLRYVVQIAAGVLAVAVGAVIFVVIRVSQNNMSSRAVKPMLIFVIVAVLALIPLVFGIKML